MKTVENKKTVDTLDKNANHLARQRTNQAVGLLAVRANLLTDVATTTDRTALGRYHVPKFSRH